MFFFTPTLHPYRLKAAQVCVSGAGAGNTERQRDRSHWHAMLPSSWSSPSPECTIRALNAAAKDRRNEKRIVLTAGRTFRASNIYRYAYVADVCAHAHSHTHVRTYARGRRAPADASLRANDACVTCERHRDAHTRKNLAGPRERGSRRALRSPACEAHGARTIQCKVDDTLAIALRDIPEVERNRGVWAWVSGSSINSLRNIHAFKLSCYLYRDSILPGKDIGGDLYEFPRNEHATKKEAIFFRNNHELF